MTAIAGAEPAIHSIGKCLIYIISHNESNKRKVRLEIKTRPEERKKMSCADTMMADRVNSLREQKGIEIIIKNKQEGIFHHFRTPPKVLC